MAVAVRAGNIAVTLLQMVVGAVCVWWYLTGTRISPTDTLHRSVSSVYYWRTVYNPTSAEQTFVRNHHVGRIYLRMFDVIEANGEAVPNATIVFKRKVEKGIEVVPTVFITVETMAHVGDADIKLLAKRIVERVSHICSWNEVENWNELQLDCDWTETTRARFFRMCQYVKAYLPSGKRLSSTIRLHQLRQEPPPVDYGVLMAYNTGSFSNPRTRNSILNDTTVAEYLNHAHSFNLPLDVALPIYHWNLIYDKNGHFQRIAYSDSVASGEDVKHEMADYATIRRTQELLEKYLHLQKGRYTVILYHLDDANIKNYSYEEIENIYRH